MATNEIKTGESRVPDAWNDDDWGASQKNATAESADKIENTKPPTPAAGAPTILLAKKPVASTSTSAEDVVNHMQNLKIWNAANESTGFDVVGNSTQPVKTVYKPEFKILKRATSTNSPERDPNKAGASQGDGSEAEARKETPQEKMERERKEKEERYAKARERLFGPDNTSNGGSVSMEKNSSSNGKNSGTATPTGGKGVNPQNKNSSRKASPSAKQRRREKIDDDFVPRSAMVAGTIESYQLDQQLQAEAQMRDMQSRTQFPMGMPPASYSGYPPQFNNATPPGNFGYNNQPGYQHQPQQAQAYNNAQGMGFQPRHSANPSGSGWNPSFSSPGSQPQPHQYNQYHNQSPHPMPYQSPPPQSQQNSSQNYQSSYIPPFQSGPGNMPNQNPGPHPQNLYDPNQSQKPPGHLQFYGQNNPNAPPTQYPVREPKAPDSSGRGGFGFSGRGGASGLGSGMQPHPPLPQGRGFPNPMYPANNQPNNQGGQNGGFNSAAAAAPWGVTNPIGTQRSPGQIWNNGPGSGNMNGDQPFPGQQPIGTPYSGFGHNNVWGNSGPWNNPGGPGIGRGKR